MVSASLDQGLARLLGLGRHLPSLALEGALLAPQRRLQLQPLLARFQPRVAPLIPALLAHDPGARRAYDALLDEALLDLRSAPLAGAAAWVNLLDRLTLLPRPEFCDDPACPEDQRRAILASIDWINEHLHSYPLWARWMRPDLLHPSGPVRVLDLAAGHGGFAIALKQLLGDAVDVTASDLFDAYLDLGRDQARRLGVQVSFVQQDATDLRNLRPLDFDVIVCTQSIHHFPPGMVARMLGEAARIARRSVWFIDAERGLLAASLLGLLMGLRDRSWPVLHDTVVSLRKMYAEEELALLGSLAPALPPGARVSTGRSPPGFCYLRVELSR
jgi:SAM-dependent methyltransferase